jgi:hypothetical protein
VDDADPPIENDPDADAIEDALSGEEKVGRVLKLGCALLLFAEALEPVSENVATGAMAAAVAVSVANFEWSDLAAASMRSCISSSPSPSIDFDRLPFVIFALLLLLLLAPPPFGAANSA